jgi:CubicO group peptidase (beta-lactamase class C family)
VEVLRQVEEWSPDNAAAAIVSPDGLLGWHGDEGREYRWASITKLVTALATLVALEEGVLDLDEPAGPPGSTVRHLLAHASGLPFDGTVPISAPGERRVYSNTGFGLLGEHLAQRAEMDFEEYLKQAVLEPLELHCELRPTDYPAADGLHGTLLDLVDLAGEFLKPTLVAQETFDEATEVVFRGLVGVLPDFGRMDPNDWGLGFEIRDDKSPHWTGTRNSPRTFGHFGGSGTFVWVDPEARLALCVLTDRPFDEWKDEAKVVWPKLSDAVLAELASEQPST